MKEGPDIAVIGSLTGDPVRANMLTALLRVPALTAGELAQEGGVTPQTASGHLRRLEQGGMLRLVQQGRHRYYALADAHVAELLEQMLGLASHLGHIRTRPGPKEPALRRARVCYDHMAGEIAVSLFDRLNRLGGLEDIGAGVGRGLTGAGLGALERMGVKLDSGRPGSRALCRPCLDWSERRPHLAGLAGAALLDRLVALDWVRRSAGSRALAVTQSGEVGLRSLFLPSA